MLARAGRYLRTAFTYPWNLLYVGAGVAVAVFAAKTYDTGADAVLLQSTGEDRPALIAPAPEG